MRKNRSSSELAQPDIASLFTDTDGTTPAPEEIRALAVMVAVKLIEPDPSQPREFDDDYEQSEDHEELVATVKKYGVLQPLVLRPIKHDKNGNPRAYRLVAGERRLRAAKTAGLDQVPAILRDYNEQQILEVQIIENGARKNLTDLEAATAYKRLADEFGYTQTQIAQATGKSQGEISRFLSVFNDPVLREYVTNGQITMTEAREMVTIKADTDRANFARETASRRNQGKTVPLSGLRQAIKSGDPEKLKAPQPPANNGITISRSQSHQPTPRQPTPSQRAAQLLDDMRHGVSVWSGVAVQVEENGARVAPELARDINAELDNMQAQIDRIRVVVPKTAKVRMVS